MTVGEVWDSWLAHNHLLHVLLGYHLASFLPCFEPSGPGHLALQGHSATPLQNSWYTRILADLRRKCFFSPIKLPLGLNMLYIIVHRSWCRTSDSRGCQIQHSQFKRARLDQKRSENQSAFTRIRFGLPFANCEHRLVAVCWNLVLGS